MTLNPIMNARSRFGTSIRLSRMGTHTVKPTIATASYPSSPAPPFPPNPSHDQSCFWSYASADFGPVVGTAEICVLYDHVRLSNVAIARTRMFEPDQQVVGILQADYHQAHMPCLPLELRIPKVIVLGPELNREHKQNKVTGTDLHLDVETLRLPACSTMYMLTYLDRSH
jgi:hypothetical protein